MSVYKRGKVWWYKFSFAGQKIRESANTTNINVARKAERNRRREFEEGVNGITKAQRIKLFSVASKAWLKSKSVHWSTSTQSIEKHNLDHLLPVFGPQLLCDITADDVAAYQADRMEEEAANKTINLEVGTLRAILRKNRLWANLQPDVKMLRVRDDIGKALAADQEERLLQECRVSRSRSLYPATELRLQTGTRRKETRLLKWQQIDFDAAQLTIGESKTDAGDGRVIPLNSRILTVLRFWAEMFPNRQPEHYVFPSEKYGAEGDAFKACTYNTDPTTPIGDWKEAWEAAKMRAAVVCRGHDLRHTACTRMLEAGVPFSVVAVILGWSPSTAIRMAKRYGHIGDVARKQAVTKLCEATEFNRAGAQEWAQSRAIIQKEPM